MEIEEANTAELLHNVGWLLTSNSNTKSQVLLVYLSYLTDFLDCTNDTNGTESRQNTLSDTDVIEANLFVQEG